VATIVARKNVKVETWYRAQVRVMWADISDVQLAAAG